ncbi:uncharacterized membrane protein YgdD (TMEM256/DUF423 family) [Aeromicrobium panaciterrae]|uniref:Uncharacterized membrane protein YgdD (TMEM256/DUF423 family) n=1 Tax=Aeromicrobium panaciterrae TaxID=363861 RepID=A0ABU1UNZ4_9ACTN|nr:hypothetical protein [Aeromicrobium panaciterrae]MDR7086907.1 uncharacterized membrane protein YgdD (TMEM256/DUF423 family) [Aeromicrobium panaciterrae]
MTIRTQRVILAILAATGAFTGPWAAFAPQSFYDNFPGFGRHWVNVDGPYNEHLVRDVGATYLALMVLALLAAVSMERIAVLVAAATTLTFGVLHFSYHVHHLDVYDSVDSILNMTALGGSILLAALLLIPPRETSATRVPNV